MAKTRFNRSPFQVMVGLYAALVFFFAGLYCLPSSAPVPLSFADALFLSSSALSATGLTPIVVATDLTPAGQAFLMAQMQIGGIGIMATLGVFLVSSKSASFSHQALMSFDQNQPTLRSVRSLLFFIFLFALLMETLSMLFTFPVLYAESGDWRTSLFLSSFHAVSSFTNAGFDLFGGNLYAFATHSMVIFSTSLLFLAGILGFPTIYELCVAKGQKKSLFTKVNLTVQAALLLTGGLLFLLLEASRAFAPFSLKDTLLHTFFLSMSARNGGMSVLDTTAFSSSTLLLLMLLMFIGGAPSSCAGGIRTTTLAVVVARLWSSAKGNADVVLFKKTIHEEDVNKAFLITFFFLFLFFLSTFVLSVLEPLPLFPLAFEAMSALTTTGLSLGATSSLSDASLYFLSGIMMIARLGIISILYLFLTPKPSRTKYPKEPLIVG